MNTLLLKGLINENKKTGGGMTYYCTKCKKDMDIVGLSAHRWRSELTGIIWRTLVLACGHDVDEPTTSTWLGH